MSVKFFKKFGSLVYFYLFWIQMDLKLNSQEQFLIWLLQETTSQCIRMQQLLKVVSIVYFLLKNSTFKLGYNVLHWPWIRYKCYNYLFSKDIITVQKSLIFSINREFVVNVSIITKFDIFQIFSFLLAWFLKYLYDFYLGTFIKSSNGD